MVLLKPQLPANHVCIQLSPTIITDSSPLPAIIHLQATLVAAITTCKSDDPICDKKETRRLSKSIIRTRWNNILISLEKAPHSGLSPGLLLILVYDYVQ